MGFSVRRRWGLVAVAGIMALAGLVVWWLWPQREAPRARQYRDVDVCLLTDGKGLVRSGRRARVGRPGGSVGYGACAYFSAGR